MTRNGRPEGWPAEADGPAGPGAPRPDRTPGLGTTQLGSAFEQEHRGLLERRVRLVFALGIGIGLVAWTLGRLLQGAGAGAGPVSGPGGLELLYPASFAAGLAWLQLTRPGVASLQRAALLVIAANVVASLVQLGFTRPDQMPAYGIALALFLPAAFIPWRSGYQLALSAITVLAVAGAPWLGRAFVPAVRAWWEAGAAGDPGGRILANGVGTALLGATSVFVTRTLYGLRRSAFRAKRLGNYVLHEEIGRGGMGTVYVARHELMCRPTAVKVLKTTAAGLDPAALARFEREVRLSASLSHPNTITIFDFGRAGRDTFYYAMEYLTGMDLERFVERFGPVPANRCLFILGQVAGSLGEAHRRGIVHRDLKPSNVFLTVRGGLYDFVKVLDFGLAKRIEGEERTAELTGTGVVFGTPRYLAPESVHGTAGVGPQADIYAFGAVAYLMLAGRPPFTGDSPVGLMIDHVKTAPTPVSEATELDVPASLEALVMRCLAKEPADRYATVAELEEALEAVPDPDPWTRERAARWWELHMEGDDAIRDCFCPPVQELTREGEYATLTVAGPE